VVPVDRTSVATDAIGKLQCKGRSLSGLDKKGIRASVPGNGEGAENGEGENK
jgi:hypothetical protein